MVIEDFKVQPETRWRFFADTVMGGVSLGKVRFVAEDCQMHAHMTGRVSTENNGGFMQMQLNLPAPPSEGTVRVRLIVRGKDQRYFVHLSTSCTPLPWQYYQVGFDVTRDWTGIKLPLDAFAASGALLRDVPGTTNLTSIGIVAYGRDHTPRSTCLRWGFTDKPPTRKLSVGSAANQTDHSGCPAMARSFVQHGFVFGKL